MRPAEGERSAVVGFSGQYGLAARAVLAKIASLEWIRVADPNAGVADDFQFQAGGTRYAMQVKWAQYPGSFGWAELVNGSNGTAPLLGRLAEAWLRISRDWSGPLEIRLWSNEYPSTAAPRAGSVLASCLVALPIISPHFWPDRGRQSGSLYARPVATGLRFPLGWKCPNGSRRGTRSEWHPGLRKTRSRGLSAI